MSVYWSCTPCCTQWNLWNLPHILAWGYINVQCTIVHRTIVCTVKAAGASYITVHGRTRTQKGEPVNLEVIFN